MTWRSIPFQHSCLGKPLDRSAWWATVHGVVKVLDTTEYIAHMRMHTHTYDKTSISHFSSLKFSRPVQFSSVTQSCPTLCHPMNCSKPGLPVRQQLQELTQTHVHRVSDAIEPSHPLSSSSPPAPNPSQHQSLFQ